MEKQLIDVIMANDIRLVKRILKNDEDIELNFIYEKHTPLNLAISAIDDDEDSNKMVKLLLKHDADVNFKDGYGHTALYEACEAGHNEVIDTLLDEGADPNITDNFGVTPLMVACKNEDFNAVESLLINSANVDTICTFDHSTAINYAAEEDATLIVKFLLEEHGANPNIKDSDGNTALMYAVMNRNEEMVRDLLANGANVFDTLNLISTAAPRIKVLLENKIQQQRRPASQARALAIQQMGYIPPGIFQTFPGLQKGAFHTNKAQFQEIIRQGIRDRQQAEAVKKLNQGIKRAKQQRIQAEAIKRLDQSIKRTKQQR
jgi:hypothetical protein